MNINNYKTYSIVGYATLITGFSLGSIFTGLILMLIPEFDFMYLVIPTLVIPVIVITVYRKQINIYEKKPKELENVFKL